MWLYFPNSITKNEKPSFLIPCLVGRCLITTTPHHTHPTKKPPHLLHPRTLATFPTLLLPTQPKPPHKTNLTPSQTKNKQIQTPKNTQQKKIIFYFFKNVFYFFLFSILIISFTYNSITLLAPYPFTS